MMDETQPAKSSFGFLCMNVHKSRVSLETILQTANEYDLIFIQEPPRYWIKNLPSPAHPEGEEYLDTCHHPDWLTIYKQRNAATFVHKRLLDYYAFISNSPLFDEDPNIVYLGLMEKADNENTLHFLNVYNDNGTDTLHKVINGLLDHPHFAIVAGDFNLHSVEWDPQCRQESPLAQGLLDATADNGLQLLNDAGVPTWKQGESKSVIDLVFVYEDWRFTIPPPNIEFTLSDHAQITLTIPFLDAPPVLRKTIKPASEQEEEFIKFLAETINSANFQDNAEEAVARAWDSLNRKWQHLATPQPQRNVKNQWWSPECQEAKTKYQISHAEEDKLHLKRKIKTAKNIFFKSTIQEIAASRKWDLLPWTGARRYNLTHQLLDEVKQAIPPKEAIKVLHNHFAGTRPLKPNLDFLKKLERKPPREWTPFSLLEVREALTATPGNSAPGPDHISWKYIKKAFQLPGFDRSVTNMFNAIMRQGEWPSPFKESNTVVIPKPKRADYTIPKSFRPIALLNCLAKLFTKCLTRRLQDEGRRHQIFHPLQFGGMQHHSTLDAAMTIMHEISEARSRGLTVTCVAFDVAQFFPSIDHDALLTILEYQGFAKEVIQIIKTYLRNRTTSYCFGQLSDGMFDLSFGLPQGDGPSPTLASLYIAPALHISVPFDPKSSVKLMFYVDDGTIITMSTSPLKNQDSCSPSGTPTPSVLPFRSK